MTGKIQVCIFSYYGIRGTVYMMTNKHNTVLYTGVTSNLRNRVLERKTKKNSNSFTSYNCNKIVYYQFYSRIEEAIATEKKSKRKTYQRYES
jgi:putative endonuclease